MRYRGTLFVATIAFALALYPFAVSIQASGISACFSSFAADAFYYLTVARNTSWTPLFSYDTIHPTNGFHPLWQVLLKAGFSLLPALGESQAAQILFAHWVGVLCVSAAAAILALTLLRLSGNCTLSVLAVVPGLYYYAAALTDGSYGSLWSFANGMESPLLLLLASILVWSMVTGGLYRTTALGPYIRTSVLLSAILLTRLDDVFLVPALAVPLLWRRRHLGAFWRYVLALCAIPCVTLAAYGTVNWLYAGTFVPVSGVLKGGISIRANLEALVRALLPVEQILGEAWVGWEMTTWRALQLTVPAAVAATYAGIQIAHSTRRKAPPGRLSSVVVALCLYAVCKAAYALVNVDVWHQGHWYYPLSIWTCSLVLVVGGIGRVLRDVWVRLPVTRAVIRVTVGAAVAVSALLVAVRTVGPLRRAEWALPFLDNTVLLLALFGLGAAVVVLLLVVLRRRMRPLSIPVGLGLATMFVVYTANAMLAGKALDRYNEQFYRFWENRARTRADIERIYDGKGILSFDDGIIAYSLDMPTMAGLGFALDRNAARAKEEGRLLDLAYERGFTLLTSLYYMPPTPEAVGENVDVSVSRAFWLEDEDLSKWSFELVYVEPSTGCCFISFAPAAAGHASSGRELVHGSRLALGELSVPVR